MFKLRVIVFEALLTFYRRAVSWFSTLHMVKYPPTVTAGGNMLSAIVEKTQHSGVGVICLGSVGPVTEILINISHQLINSVAHHFPTRS